MSELTNYLYSSGGTRRYHNRPKLNQNVKEHSWGVAIIITTLHPNPSANLIKAALWHDCAEKKFGDFLSPAKVAFPELRELDKKLNELFWDDISQRFGLKYPELTEEEQLWLDYADMYECSLFSKEESNEDVLVDSLKRSDVLAQKLRELGYSV